MSYLDENGLARVWGKVKNFVNGKVQTDVPANAVFTDEKAKQENVTTNSEYRVLLSGSATNSTETATTKKSSKLKFKASSSELKVGDTESYGTTYHCEVSPSEIGLYRKETQQSSSSTYIGLRMWRDSSTGEYDIQNSTTWDGTNDSLREAINNATSIWNIVYPVGCYFETTDTTFDPNTAWGGTWVLEDEGLVHISSGTNYTVSANAQDGGEATHTLTAGESGVPSHSHGMTQATYKVTSSGAISGGITGGSHAHSSKGYLTISDPHAGSYKALLGNGSSTTYTTNSSTHSHDLPNHTHTVAINTNASVSDNTAKDATDAHNNMQPYKIVNRWHRTA